MAQLAPASNSPALFPDYIAQQEETVLFKGRQFGSRYDIMTVDGRALLAVEPGPMSLSRRIRVVDAKGKNIFNIRRKSWHLGGSCYFIELPSRSKNKRLLTVEFKMFTTGTKFTASLPNTIIEHQGQLCFNRSYSSTDGRITNGAGGPVIAHVERQIFMLRKEYRAIVAQGVDMALIAAMLICLDDQEKSHRNASGVGGGHV